MTTTVNRLRQTVKVWIMAKYAHTQLNFFGESIFQRIFHFYIVVYIDVAGYKKNTIKRVEKAVALIKTVMFDGRIDIQKRRAQFHWVSFFGEFSMEP